MKFIIRDDDVNYFYQPSQLENWYKGIFEICPISICAVPYVKGDYFKWVYFAEKDKEGFMAQKEEFYNDDTIHPIGDNTELITAFRQWEKDGKAAISMHGIHHRNWDRNAADIKNNYSTGAEFATIDDRTEQLKKAKTYLESVIGHSIYAFTAPQNIISYESYKSLRNAKLNVCCNLISPRNYRQFIDLYGCCKYVEVICNRFFKKQDYWKINYTCNHKGFKQITYTAGVYPNGKTLDEIKAVIDYTRQANGTFVFNTHSYAFEFFLPQANMTVKEFTIELLNYVKQFDDVEFTTLEEVLK